MKDDSWISCEAVYEKMFAALTDYGPLPDTLRELLYQNSRVYCFCRGDLLLAENKECQMVYFIIDGFCSGFYNKDGKEWVTCFLGENKFCSSWYSFLGGHESFIGIKAVKKTCVVGINREEFDHLLACSPEFVYVINNVLKRYLVDNEINMYIMRSCSAKERILHYMDTHEIYYLMKYVPQYSIASYLGMTAEVFSKLMKEIKEGL